MLPGPITGDVNKEKLGGSGEEAIPPFLFSCCTERKLFPAISIVRAFNTFGDKLSEDWSQRC